VSFRHLWAVTRKEIQHILRDRTTFFLVILSPAVLLFIMAYALTVDLQNIPLAVLDYDRSAVSRSFYEQITAGDDLDLFAVVNAMQELEELLLKGDIKAALVIDPAFSHDIMAARGAPIQIIIDGTEPESGTFALEHISWRAEKFLDAMLADYFRANDIQVDTLQPIDLRVRAWYNPGLKPKVAIIPGLLSMVLGLPAMSVALTMAREREHGTLEQILATPVKRLELLLGKMVPYIIVGLFNVIVLPLIAVLWFEIPFNGSFVLFFLLSILFFFAVLSMGLVVGVFMRTQPAALALSFLVIFFPGFFLTGIFFPIASMPEMMRMEALFLPGTHYATITRSIFLTGAGLDVLWPYGIMLLVLGFAFSGVAALFFRKKLA
jgi:ABC-2 type transport system permease protein